MTTKYQVSDHNQKYHFIEADSFYNQSGTLEFYDISRTESGYKDRTFVAAFPPGYWQSCIRVDD